MVVEAHKISFENKEIVPLCGISSCLFLLLRLQSSQNDLVLSPKQTQGKDRGCCCHGEDGLEDEKLLHVLGRIGIVSGCERIANNNENSAEELATGPGRS